MAAKKPRKIRKPTASKVPEPVAPKTELKTETAKPEAEQTEKLSGQAQALINLLKKGNKPVPEISRELDLSTHALYDLAEELSSKGYDIRVFAQGDEKVFTLVKAEEEATLAEALPIAVVNKKFRIAVVSNVRMGSKQAQISLLHWIYKDCERDDVDCVLFAGDLVVGKPTPTLAPDVIKSDADSLVAYVVKHFPASKKFKTHIVGGKGELSWKDKEGFDILSAICQQRPDLSKAGDLQRTFNFKGVLIKVICPYDDNSPIGVSYGPQKIADNLRDNPMPNILVIGGTHRRSRIPAYNGVYVETVPSLHTQMRRQARRGVAPQIGYTILELNFQPDWSFDISSGLRVYMNNLDVYADPRDCFGVDLTLAEKLDEVSRKVLDWFVSEPILSEGDLSRRLGQSKDSVKKIIDKLTSCGYKIVFKSDMKRYALEVKEKEQFSPTPVKWEDVYQFKTKEAVISDTHFGSKEDMPAVVRKAFEEAAKAGVRRVYHPGDFSDGPGALGYRGHQNDVKFITVDDLEDYIVSLWPKIKIKVNPEKPLLVTKLSYDENGKYKYEETLVKEGEVWLQTDAIEGNHDGWAWNSYGHKIVRAIAARLPEQIRHLGYLHGVAVVDGVYHKIIHPAGGLGYTMSFKLQKHMRALRQRSEAGGLPVVTYLGNWHSAYLLFDQDLGMIVPCYKDEDDFHVTRALLPFVGMFVSEIYTDKDGKTITRVVSEYRNHYPLAKQLRQSQQNK